MDRPTSIAPAGSTAASNEVASTSVENDSLGLSIDMLDVDRLRQWASNIAIYGSGIGYWASPTFVSEELQRIASALEQAIRDIGMLRASRDDGSMVAAEYPNKADGEATRSLSVDNSIDPSPPPNCLDCGLAYEFFPLDVLLSRSQWLEIHPAENGLLCAACIVRRAAKVPGVTCVRAILEIAPHRPIDPSSGVANRTKENDK